MPIPDNATWVVESLRLTVFLAEPNPDMGAEWWSNIAGHDPETSTFKRQSGERIDDGEFEAGRLWLNCNVGPAARVDWVFYPQPTAVGALQSVGDLETIGRFVEILKPWLQESCPRTIRLAFAVTALSPTDSRDSAYRFLRTALPFITFDSDNWSDFVFQVNKRLPLQEGLPRDIPLTHAHCFTRWAAIKAIHGVMESSTPIFAESNAARVEIDISTHPDNKVALSAEGLAALFDEFAGIAHRVSREGFL
jgi:hypothetical protein